MTTWWFLKSKTITCRMRIAMQTIMNNYSSTFRTDPIFWSSTDVCHYCWGENRYENVNIKYLDTHIEQAGTHLFWSWSCPPESITGCLWYFSQPIWIFYFLKKPIFFQATPYATHMDGNKVGGNMQWNGHQSNQEHPLHITKVPLYLTLGKAEHHC